MQRFIPQQMPDQESRDKYRMFRREGKKSLSGDELAS